MSALAELDRQTKAVLEQVRPNAAQAISARREAVKTLLARVGQRFEPVSATQDFVIGGSRGRIRRRS
jgi:hypothetical protein